DQVRLQGGEIIVDDRQTNRTFAIEQIQLYIPSSLKREGPAAEKPRLRAIIDASPFEVVGTRFRSQEGVWRTGFTFSFEQVLINNFKELLPLPDTLFSLSEGEADALVEALRQQRVTVSRRSDAASVPHVRLSLHAYNTSAELVRFEQLWCDAYAGLQAE
ncbi:MAG: hypothetical protein R3248_10670, partial [Candidatus Promineifilaceae bacterium]|nr:hypothetical protein [Candidatus Promineifilaceae bacterium]